MQLPAPQRLYQKTGLQLKERILSGRYKEGERLPAERDLAEELGVSRTVVREALIMLELQGLVEVRKGSGIYVLTPPDEPQAARGDDEEDALTAGPFEMLQARQLIESQIAAFAATLITKNDIQKLMEISQQARREDRYQDSEWDKRFHLKIAESTQNAVLVYLVEKLWHQRDKNQLWQKLHDRIDNRQSLDSWCDDHDVILKALIRRDSDGAQKAMWQHLENTKEMLFKASTLEEEDEIDYYLFADKATLKG
ncbi:GntR family transcriptional regulator [Halomonas aquamarina]|uniref:GntR family transcriptional regulator n=1 Tax=Vreelandella aquamarina TaxID=77097 RepID=A0ACC5VRK2_9GAMM|nr:GntR family transcriptional regulator [Halomonas aquamarina]MBZ5486539.1 GntR family transcriptional regulator [Halomonas aquamarina]